jgi:N-acetylglucosaminyl-diphospho-decaprenol L-rhamnosyltransferase
MSDIGIIIVTYNSAAEIGACLDAALASGAEIVVIDNASHDATIAEVTRRGVRFIANPVNRGFAGAVNQGFTEIKSPYVLLLNPDAVIRTSLEPLRQACDSPGAAGACGQLVDAAGQPQVGFMVRKLPTPGALVLEALLLNRCWPGNPVNRRYRCLDWDSSSRSTVEQPAGAFLMVRRAIWQELGGLDESFFPLWFEDVDFCRRIRNRGLSLYYIPESVAEHTGAHSIPHLALEIRLIYWYRSLLRYSAKHFGPFAFRSVCLAVVMGSILRGVAQSALHRSFKPMAAHGKVASLAVRSLFCGC